MTPNAETFKTTFKTKQSNWILTKWRTAHYDVWGNARDGYEVNDVYRHREEIEIRCRVTVYNAGTPQEWRGASPSDSQIRQALELRRFKIETDGDDLVIYVNRAKDGFPVGEMECVSHASLSPIREKMPEPVRLLECVCCGEFHPDAPLLKGGSANPQNDCRFDGNRFRSVEDYKARTGKDAVEVMLDEQEEEDTDGRE